MNKRKCLPCTTCDLPCPKARGKKKKEEPAIAREIRIQKFKEKGCPYVRRSNL